MDTYLFAIECHQGKFCSVAIRLAYSLCVTFYLRMTSWFVDRPHVDFKAGQPSFLDQRLSPSATISWRYQPLRAAIRMHSVFHVGDTVRESKSKSRCHVLLVKPLKSSSSPYFSGSISSDCICDCSCYEKKPGLHLTGPESHDWWFYSIVAGVLASLPGFLLGLAWKWGQKKWEERKQRKKERKEEAAKEETKAIVTQVEDRSSQSGAIIKQRKKGAGQSA